MEYYEKRESGRFLFNGVYNVNNCQVVDFIGRETSNDFAIEFWLKANLLFGASYQSKSVFEDNKFFNVSFNSYHSICFTILDMIYSPPYSHAPENEYVHYACVRKADGNLRFYIDGLEIMSTINRRYFSAIEASKLKLSIDGEFHGLRIVKGMAYYKSDLPISLDGVDVYRVGDYVELVENFPIERLIYK